jgi:hypothetical protein
LIWPQKNYWLRPDSGRTYPRNRIKHKRLIWYSSEYGIINILKI